MIMIEISIYYQLNTHRMRSEALICFLRFVMKLIRVVSFQCLN